MEPIQHQSLEVATLVGGYMPRELVTATHMSIQTEFVNMIVLILKNAWRITTTIAINANQKPEHLGVPDIASNRKIKAPNKLNCLLCSKTSPATNRGGFLLLR